MPDRRAIRKPQPKPASPTVHSHESRRSLTELFHNNASEVVKLYSSVHRVHNYFRPSHTQIDFSPKLGKERLIRKFSETNNVNVYTPKLSLNAYTALKADRVLWKLYQQEVLKNDIIGKNPEFFSDVKTDYQVHNGKTKPTYLRVLHNLESSWLHQRAYYKLFNDYHKRPKIFLELEAFTMTHSNQFFMRHFLKYLEGNYVVSVRGTGKVYVPHLQADLDSVDLPYTSAHGIGHSATIADYFEKAQVNSTEQLLQNFKQMRDFEAEMSGGSKDKIFLNSSQYVNQERYFTMCQEWLTHIGNELFATGIKDRYDVVNAIDTLVKNKKLQLPDDLFNADAPDLALFIDNYKDDWNIFCKVDTPSAIKRLLRSIFVSMIEYSFNRHRMESRGGPGSETERTEYETVFRRYRDMTQLEKNLNCLLVEDGEISLVLLLSNYLKQLGKSFFTIADFKKWGLVEPMHKNQPMYKYSARAQRMAKWCAKVAGWNLHYKNGRQLCELNYAQNKELRSHYDPLTHDQDALFHWMLLLKDTDKLQQLLSEIALATRKKQSESEIIQEFKSFCDLCLTGNEEKHKEKVDFSVRQQSRFNRELNEFLRTNETISRSVVAIPISTIPTDLPGFRDKIYGFSIFIGTFQFSEGLDDEQNFAAERQDIAEILRAAKTYFTLIGKPASEVLNHFVVREVSAKRVASALGKFAHSLKNEGVSFRAQIDTLKELVKREFPNAPISAKVNEFEKSFERFSGAIQLLNLASNPLQSKYLDQRPYCLLDIIFQAYCNAFEQFLVAGPRLELNKLRTNVNFFRSPILRVSVENHVQPQVYSVQPRCIQYFPNLPNIAFDHPATPKPDAEVVLSKTQLFRDLLPERNMLLSVYLEIFNNVLQYSLKEVENLYIDVNVKRHKNEIVVEIINEASLENLQRLITTASEDEDQFRARGAGVDTNTLFFKNIGGEFRLVPDLLRSRALAISRIDLQFLEQFKRQSEL